MVEWKYEFGLQLFDKFSQLRRRKSGGYQCKRREFLAAKRVHALENLDGGTVGWGNVGGVWGAYVNRPQGVMDIGLTRKLWDGDGTFRLSFSDVFHSSKWSSYLDLGTLHIEAQGTWEGQQVKSNFTYRFGNKQLQGSRRRSSASEDEKKRAGADGGGGQNQ